MKRKVVLIGPGRVGQTMARQLQEAGHEIIAVIGRDLARAEAAARFIGAGRAGTDLAVARGAEVVLLAVPDDALASVAAALRSKGFLGAGAVLVHFSGLHSGLILDGPGPAAPGGLSLHPMQTFADAASGVRLLAGSSMTVEGSEELLPLGEELVRDLGARPLRLVRAAKPLYHAAACVASNYLVALFAAARDLLCEAGIDPDETKQLLLPLVRGTVDNLAAGGPEVALTGPIARGDSRTVTCHLEALNAVDSPLLPLYRLLGDRTVHLARDKGTLTKAKAEELLRLLSGPSARS